MFVFCLVANIYVGNNSGVKRILLDMFVFCLVASIYVGKNSGVNKKALSFVRRTWGLYNKETIIGVTGLTINFGQLIVFALLLHLSSAF